MWKKCIILYLAKIGMHQYSRLGNYVPWEEKWYDVTQCSSLTRRMWLKKKCVEDETRENSSWNNKFNSYWDKKENVCVRRLSHKSIRTNFSSRKIHFREKKKKKRTNFSFLLCLSYLLSKRMKYVKQVINKIWPWNGIYLLNAKLLTCTIYVVYFEVEYSKIPDHLSEFTTFPTLSSSNII